MTSIGVKELSHFARMLSLSLEIKGSMELFEASKT